MDLVQLKYYSKIVEHQSFTKAAQACSVSQPALSQQVRKLEKELGQPLFERQGRSIQITPAGKLLADHAIKILQLVDDAKRQIMDDGQTGNVCLAAIPTIGPYLLPELVGYLTEQFESARFMVDENTTIDLLKNVVSGEIHVGFIALPVNEKRLIVEPLFSEELVLALPSHHKLCGASEICLEDLLNEPFVMLDDVHCLVANIETFCSRQHFLPATTSRIHQVVTVQNLVATGLGVSFVPKMACGENCAGRITYRSLSAVKPDRTIAMVYNPCRYQSQLLINALKAIREVLSTDDYMFSDTVTGPKSISGQTRVPALPKRRFP